LIFTVHTSNENFDGAIVVAMTLPLDVDFTYANSSERRRSFHCQPRRPVASSGTGLAPF
jgi:hypothetical protein